MSSEVGSTPRRACRRLRPAPKPGCVNHLPAFCPLCTMETCRIGAAALARRRRRWL